MEMKEGSKAGAEAARRRNGRTLSDADRKAFKSAAGAWKDVDVERLKKDIRASRDIPSRPPVEL
jgi:hypothetical protein